MQAAGHRNSVGGGVAGVATPAAGAVAISRLSQEKLDRIKTVSENYIQAKQVLQSGVACSHLFPVWEGKFFGLFKIYADVLSDSDLSRSETRKLQRSVRPGDPARRTAASA